MSPRPVLVVLGDDVDKEGARIHWEGLAGKCHHEVLLLHVEDRIFPVPCLQETGGAAMIPGPPREAYVSWENDRCLEAKRRLASVRAQLPGEWAVRERLEWGGMVESTCRVAADQGAARILLLLGRGQRWWDRWLASWVARRIADQSSLPVHIIGRPDWSHPRRTVLRAGVRSVFPRIPSSPNASSQ